MSASRASSPRPSRRKLAVSVAAVFALGGASVVHANTFFVTNCAQSGPGSLFAAQSAVSGDTVSIGITDNSLCSHNLNGVTEVLVVNSTPTFGDGVTINGPGASTFGISGKHAYRALKSTGALTVNDLTVMYGKYLKATNGAVAYGGCIYGHNGLTLSGVTADDCYAHLIASTGGAKGGAFATFLGPVSMTNTTVTNARAYGATLARGGAVYSFGDLTMTHSTISGATAKAAGASTTDHTRGGGTFSFGKTTLDTGSVITQTTAYQTATTGGTANGGGIWSSGNVFVHGGSVVSHGSAKTESNQLALGGGIYSAGSVTTGYIADTSTVQLNTAYSKTGTARGGGIYGKNHVTAKYSYITSNNAGGTSYGRAGGIYALGGFTSKYSYFWNNSGTSGGAVIVPTGNTYLRGTSMAFNKGTNGFSGLDAWSGCNISGDPASTVTILQSTIAYNHPSTATAGGANGIYTCGNVTQLYNNTIAYNSGSSAAVRIKGSGTTPALTITSNLMTGNNYGATPTLNDLSTSGVTVSGDHNFIRAPGGGVPADTIVGKCPLLYRGVWTPFGAGIQDQFVIRHEVPSPATNAGSNPKNFTTDQRGGGVNTTPPRVSGPPGGPAVADIGSYEIDQSDEIYDERFEGCKI